MPSASKPRRKPKAESRKPQPRPTGEFELVEPAFLLKGLAAVFGGALILSYAILCVVYSRGSWQLVLHPSPTVAMEPSSQGLHFTEVHFGVDASGQPQLDGWWIPAGSPTARTVLMLHGADGNMATSLPMAATFHSLNLNVLLFDYRGYGRSGDHQPTEAHMEADTQSALSYLINERHLLAGSVIPYGHDLGASLALHLCATASINCPALILDSPDGDTLARASKDPRSRAVPASILFRERFPLATPLSTSPVPKLLILHSNNQPPAALRTAHDPKMLLSLQPGDDTALRVGIQRFLDDSVR